MFKRLIVIILLILATVGYSLYKKKSLESQLAGEASTVILDKVPAATFATLDGKEVSLHELYKNESIGLLVVHFWGTWCGPCEAELPELLSLIKRFEGKPGVKFLLVAVNDELLKVQKHLKTLAPNKATWLLDNHDAYRSLFGTYRVPETYVFSSDMVTLRKYVGPQDWNKELFFQTFDEFFQISTRKL